MQTSGNLSGGVAFKVSQERPSDTSDCKVLQISEMLIWGDSHCGTLEYGNGYQISMAKFKDHSVVGDGNTA